MTPVCRKRSIHVVQLHVQFSACLIWLFYLLRYGKKLDQMPISVSNGDIIGNRLGFAAQTLEPQEESKAGCWLTGYKGHVIGSRGTGARDEEMTA